MEGQLFNFLNVSQAERNIFKIVDDYEKGRVYLDEESETGFDPYNSIDEDEEDKKIEAENMKRKLVGSIYRTACYAPAYVNTLKLPLIDAAEKYIRIYFKRVLTELVTSTHELANALDIAAEGRMYAKGAEEGKFDMSTCVYHAFKHPSRGLIVIQELQRLIRGDCTERDEVMMICEFNYYDWFIKEKDAVVDRYLDVAKKDSIFEDLLNSFANVKITPIGRTEDNSVIWGSSDETKKTFTWKGQNK